MTDPLIPVLEALEFAAFHHRNQRRSGLDSLPYINHLIKVASRLAGMGADSELILAGVLHDIIEDTDLSEEVIRQKFGRQVSDLVVELSDDMRLPYIERKQSQVDKAADLSPGAKLIRIVDKICNVKDLGEFPVEWSNQKKKAYIEFSRKVTDQLRSDYPDAVAEFDRIADDVISKIDKRT